MYSKEVQKFIINLQKRISSSYSVTENEASSIVESSSVTKLIEECPHFVTHYSINSWADEIWCEHRGLPVNP